MNIFIFNLLPPYACVISSIFSHRGTAVYTYIYLTAHVAHVLHHFGIKIKTLNVMYNTVTEHIGQKQSRGFHSVHSCGSDWSMKVLFIEKHLPD